MSNSKTNLVPDRHPLLPKGTSAEELKGWLEKSAVERGTHTKIRKFTEEEISDMEHESVLKGREMNRLNDQLAEIAACIKKGIVESKTFVIPATVGTKLLTEHRRQDEDMVERGAEEETISVYGLPTDFGNTFQMIFFDETGEEVLDKNRGLSAKEKHKYFGMFQQPKKPNNVDGNGEVKDGTND